MNAKKLFIRPSEHKDDHEVGELLVRSFDIQNRRLMPGVVCSSARRQDLRNQIKKRELALVLVGEIEGVVAGTVTLFPPGSEGNEAWLAKAVDLRCLAVHQDYFGKGLSQLFLEKCIDVAGEWSAGAVCLHIRRGAKGLGRLYERNGFARDPLGDIDAGEGAILDGYSLCLDEKGEAVALPPALREEYLARAAARGH